ncbi:hypothetical protein LSPCS325_20540 [Lysinibacillus sp. CTST325]
MRKISLLLFGIIFTLLVYVPSLAEASEVFQDVDYEVGNTPVVDLSEDDTMYEAELNDEITITPRFGPTDIKYKITKKEIVGRGWGDWRNGPTGTGPGSLSINHAKTLNREFTNTISGEYPIGASTIGTSLGVTIGKAKTYGTTYTITLAKGEKKRIIFQPRYVTYEVTQRMYANGIATDKYKKAYVDVFDDWDYDWVNMK